MVEFGAFITPTSAAPQVPVALARRADELGLDLVTFQDHPYQPAFLDTWTLMSWVAGQTERVRLAGNVLNIPLRNPAVLARAATSLDLLSGGRLELALGAGAFWDAIEAMGGRRLAPGQAVDALSEAIDVIRGVFEAGSAPAHDIPIWLGARRRRMLRLIGQKADGWLPTLGYLDPGELRAGNKIIDEAAVEAGRDPVEIRRLVNISGRFADRRGGFLDGPPEQWVEDLLPLAIEDRVGTFILMTDDASTLERFAREVAPALRAATPDTTATGRSARVRAKRRQGIDYDGVPPSLTAIEPGDIGYARVRSTYLRGGSPGLVLRPRDTAQVVEALAYARAHPALPLGIRSGGHGVSGRSTNDGGIVIDLSTLAGIEVLDESTRRVRIGPGARWKHVAAALDEYDWALSSGDYGGVGVGGLATAGGIGFLGRKYGLTIDHLRAAEVVLADGTVVHASAGEHPDLFWALRGAGANFGIVTSFEFEVDEVREVGWAHLGFAVSDVADFLRRFGDAVAATPRDTTPFLLVSPPRRGQPALAQLMAMVDAADPETVIAQLQPFAELAPMYQQQVVIAPYAAVMGMAPDGDHQGQGEPIARSAFVREITPAFAAISADLLRGGVVYWYQLRTVGGAIADVDPDATAYAHRDAGFQLTAMGTDQRRMDALWDSVRGHFDGLYLSFETDRRPERLADAFPPRTLARLRELKARYDPDNVFRDNFNIPVGTS
ncbi:LLM class flavin-dependent oxidoreductase [Micromonospora sp. CPCC 206061]|uniref:LLM class flavin-dependent oxidoreductase n=1 Tax=Micromonospora sp. CPCC 206061 TaxID=3122410 RepID=UPI002FF28772